VVLSLVAAYCTPVLLYGLEAVTLNKTERTRLNNPFNMVFTKLFGTFNKEIIKSCQYYCGYLPFDLLLDMKILRFLKKIFGFCVYNMSLFSLFKISGEDEFLTLAAKYNIVLSDSDRAIKRKIWHVFGDG